MSSLHYPLGTLHAPGLTFNSSTFCPHSVFMCFVWIWEQTAIISLNSINWLVFVTETECVYSAVRTGSLNTKQADRPPMLRSLPHLHVATAIRTRRWTVGTCQIVISFGIWTASDRKLLPLKSLEVEKKHLKKNTKGYWNITNIKQAAVEMRKPPLQQSQALFQHSEGPLLNHYP